jgi:hypothetical protein
MELEDKIINFISPVHTKLSMALMGHGGLMEKDLRMMIGRIEKAADYIHSRHKSPILHRNRY